MSTHHDPSSACTKGPDEHCPLCDGEALKPRPGARSGTTVVDAFGTSWLVVPPSPAGFRQMHATHGWRFGTLIQGRFAQQVAWREPEPAPPPRLRPCVVCGTPTRDWWCSRSCWRADEPGEES